MIVSIQNFFNFKQTKKPTYKLPQTGSATPNENAADKNYPVLEPTILNDIAFARRLRINHQSELMFKRVELEKKNPVSVDIKYFYSNPTKRYQHVPMTLLEDGSVEFIIKSANDFNALFGKNWRKKHPDLWDLIKSKKYEVNEERISNHLGDEWSVKFPNLLNDLKSPNLEKTFEKLMEICDSYNIDPTFAKLYLGRGTYGQVRILIIYTDGTIKFKAIKKEINPTSIKKSIETNKKAMIASTQIDPIKIQDRYNAGKGLRIEPHLTTQMGLCVNDTRGLNLKQDPELLLFQIQNIAKQLQQLNDEQNLFHCDIKPSNIFIDPEGKFIVADYDLLSDRDLNLFNKMSVEFQFNYVTFWYRSPEQLVGAPLISSPDLSSLALSTLEWINGSMPDFIKEFSFIFENKKEFNEIVKQAKHTSIDDINQFFENIPAGSLSQIKQFLEKYSNLKQNTDNASIFILQTLVAYQKNLKLTINNVKKTLQSNNPSANDDIEIICNFLKQALIPDKDKTNTTWEHVMKILNQKEFTDTQQAELRTNLLTNHLKLTDGLKLLNKNCIL